MGMLFSYSRGWTFPSLQEEGSKEEMAVGEYEQNDSWPLHEGHLDQRQSRIKTLENHENKVTASCDVKKKKKGLSAPGVCLAQIQ